MRHYEEHTFVITFCKDTLGEHRLALHQELYLFMEAWPNAKVEVGTNWVSIGYSNRSNCYNTALDAAEQFRQAVKRHSWWKEIE